MSGGASRMSIRRLGWGPDPSIDTKRLQSMSTGSAGAGAAEVIPGPRLGLGGEDRRVGDRL